MGLCAFNDERLGDEPGRFRFYAARLWQKRRCRALVWGERGEIRQNGRVEARLSVSRNALLRFLVRFALTELEAGRLTPETKETVQVKLELP